MTESADQRVGKPSELLRADGKLQPGWPWRAMTAFLALLLAVAGLGTATGPAAASGKKLVDPGLYESLQWRNIGPTTGGRSIAVAGSTARPNEYYFGATGGGLWKTTDGGANWSPVTDGQITSASVGAIEVCPTNPDIVYIGMGEVEFRGDVLPGDGVYKSTDGGTTWKHMGLTDTQMIGRVRVDPTNCDRVFVAALGHGFGPNTERGVFRSTDGGETWQRTLYRDDLTGAVDLSIDPADPQVMYAALWHAYRKPWLLNSGGDSSGLFKSTDGGSTWTELTNNLGLPDGPLGKIGISVSGADSNRVYAVIEAANGGMFRSDDAGATWQLVDDSANLRQRAFYYTRIYADPVNRDRVYVLNTSFYRSDDAGANWQTISTPHGDNHDLWIDPNNNRRMIEGNDGGANVSTNGGANWTDQDYQTAQMYHVATTNNDPYLVCGAQQDRSTVCVSSTGGTGNFTVGGGESSYVAVDPRDSNVFYAGNYGGNLTRLDRSGLSGIGSRRIDVWPDNPMGSPAKDIKERFQWTYPIMTNPAEPNAVFAGSQYVYKSTNSGQSWQRISPDLTYADPETLGDSGGPITKDQTSVEYFATVFSIAPSTRDPNVIWTGSDDGLVHVTRQGGSPGPRPQAWRNVTPPGLEKYSTVSMIDAGHHNTDTAYVSAHRYRLDDFRPYIYRTHSGGASWEEVTNGIADNDWIYAVREDPERKGLLYAAAEHGVYVSFNDGDNWQPLSLNLPDIPVTDLTVKNGDLVIATHGRSFWVLDDGATLLRQLTPKTTRNDIADFEQTVPPVTPLPSVSPPPAVIPPTNTAPDQENDLAILKDPNNPVRGVSSNATVSYTIKQPVESATMSFLDAQGEVIQTVNLPTTAGTRTQNWNLRYPGSTSFPGLIYWSANSTGAQAPVGTHGVRLTANGQSLDQSFEILRDSRLTQVSDADLLAQFKLAKEAVDRTSDANNGVIAIRDCSGQIADRIEQSGDDAVTAAGNRLQDALSVVENELYQTRLRSGQDPLNFPIKLNNKMAGLRGVIESTQSPPTDQSYEVLEELSGQLQKQLDRLDEIVTTDVPAFNQVLQSKGLQPITCAA
ncbi:hypothetical protein [Micromonospora sp. ATA51]|uniref:VPS10 domain-containing protein n=1 Tax=Micromonospora sp. ATA51 TaxID=2806098 RepID=UPI001A411F20|nr:hypothetical protein [Micromonospora sp. ATA51]MBM0228263.1 hypothetical protein [Micromonospora sp. ATA51]